MAHTWHNYHKIYRIFSSVQIFDINNGIFTLIIHNDYHGKYILLLTEQYCCKFVVTKEEASCKLVKRLKKWE